MEMVDHLGVNVRIPDIRGEMVLDP